MRRLAYAVSFGFLISLALPTFAAGQEIPDGELGMITTRGALLRAEPSKDGATVTRLEVGSFILADEVRKDWVHVLFRIQRDGDVMWMDAWTKRKHLQSRSRHGFTFERAEGAPEMPARKLSKPPPPVKEIAPPKSGFGSDNDNSSRSEWEEELNAELEKDDEWKMESDTDADDLDAWDPEDLDRAGEEKAKKKKKKND